MSSGKPLRDYYKILGVSNSASSDEIRSAYRSLARKFHPDINNSDDGEFWIRMINEAYSVLGNKRKKALYDYIFFAYGSYSSQDKSEKDFRVSGIGNSQNSGFRNSISHFVVSVVGLEEALNIGLAALVLFAVALYLVFGQAELSAGMIALLFVLASIGLMVRIIAEIFSRVGVRQEEEWFHEAFILAGYLPQSASSVESKGTKDS